MFPITIHVVNTWLTAITQVVAILAGLAVFVGGFTLVFDYRKGARDAVRLKEEEWRISYRNLNITHTTVLTHPVKPPIALPEPGPSRSTRKVSPEMVPSPQRQAPVIAQPNATQFLIFQLEVENIGDGPVDVWACLVAARELNAGDHRESWGGNIEWNDLDPYYFDTHKPEWEELAGISNTRHLVYSQDDYIALDPKEHDSLTRIDRIDPVRRHVTLLYRAFLVGRGYGGNDRGRAVRDVLAWQRLQQALFNISGPSFRIMFNEADPLDIVADRDGFPCFVLYHMGFIDDNRDQIGWTNVDWVNSLLEGEWGMKHDFPEALQLVEEKLAIYKTKWQRHWAAFNQAVKQAKKLKRGFAELVKSDWKPTLDGEPLDKSDITAMTAKQAFARLPVYLRWDPDDDDGLPIWEKFFLAPLHPDADAPAAPAQTVAQEVAVDVSLDMR